MAITADWKLKPLLCQGNSGGAGDRDRTGMASLEDRSSSILIKRQNIPSAR